MDEKTRELIAIGASVSAHCQPCLAWHLAKAKEFGVIEEDIRAATELGFMVARGAESAMRKAVAEQSRQPAAPVTACCSGETPAATKCCG